MKVMAGYIDRRAAVDAVTEYLTDKTIGDMTGIQEILERLPSVDIREQSVDIGYLYDWYQDSVDPDDEPVWTNKHIDEVFHDFYLIPKQAMDGNGGD